MKEYAAGVQPSDLRLIDVPGSARKSASVGAGNAPVLARRNADGTIAPLSGSAAVGDASASSGAPVGDDEPAAQVVGATGTGTSQASPDGTADKFLTAAAKEFEAGIVDQPLWKRAVAQTGGDRNLATRAYLRARATALRVSKREKRQERSARRERAMNELVQPADAGSTSARDEPSSRPPAAIRPRGLRPRRQQVMWIGGALASLFALALFAALRTESGAVPQRTATPPTAVARAGAPRPAAPAAPAAKADSAARHEAPSENLAARITALKSAGNWNLVVLYTVEWIRKEPENATAWKELSTGYAKLRQYREALDAATRVVQITPEDAAAWQSVGQLNVILQQPVDALAAFEQAIARNDRDATSMVQTGLLHTQLGRFTDARLAFAKALALNAEDVDALCGAAALARKEGRAKDAEAMTRQVASLDSRCRDANPGESVRVAVGANRAAGASAVR